MRFFLFALCLILFETCGQKFQPATPDITRDEYSILNLALQKAIIPDSVFKRFTLDMDSMTPRFPPPMKLKLSVIVHEARLRKLHFDSLKRLLDTMRLSVYIRDSLAKFPDEYLKPSAADMITRQDDDTVKMLKRIAKSLVKTNKATRLDKTRIAPVYNYHLVFFRKKSPRLSQQISPGEIYLSRVRFNKDHTTGCLYVETFKQSLWAEGFLIYVIKKGNTWEVLRKTPLWIS